MYLDNTSSSAPYQLKQVQQQYGHMHLAKINTPEIRGYHTWTVEMTFHNQYI